MGAAPEVLEAGRGQILLLSTLNNSRIELLEVGLNKVVLDDFDKSAIRAFGRGEVSFALERSKVDLSYKLNDKSRPQLWENGMVGRVDDDVLASSPSHQGVELGLVVEAACLVWVDGIAAEDVGHREDCGKVG